MHLFFKKKKTVYNYPELKISWQGEVAGRVILRVFVQLGSLNLT